MCGSVCPELCFHVEKIYFYPLLQNNSPVGNFLIDSAHTCQRQSAKKPMQLKFQPSTTISTNQKTDVNGDRDMTMEKFRCHLAFILGRLYPLAVISLKYLKMWVRPQSYWLHLLLHACASY